MRRLIACSVVVVLLVGARYGHAEAVSVWAVGDRGTIIHSDDMGTTWTVQDSGTTDDLKDVHFVDANTGWAVGRSGTILHTTDGGVNWTPQTSGTASALSSVHFTDRDHGWVLADSTFAARTSNGGATWEEAGIPLIPGYSSGVGVHFFDSQDGWLAFFGRSFFHSTDGGATWAASSPEFHVLEVDFVDPLHIRGVGSNGLFVKTDDGGATWATSAPGTSSIHLVSFVDPDCGWIVNPWSQVMHTTDGGATWDPHYHGLGYVPTEMMFVDQDRGWLFSKLGWIGYTIDGGVTFTRQFGPTDEFLRASAFTAPIPCPSTLLGLLSMGVAGLVLAVLRRRRSGRPAR